MESKSACCVHRKAVSFVVIHTLKGPEPVWTTQLSFCCVCFPISAGGLLSGITGSGVQDVLFENVHIQIAAWSHYSTGAAGTGWPVRFLHSCYIIIIIIIIIVILYARPPPVSHI